MLAFSGRRGETGGGRSGAASKVDREQKGTAEAKGIGGERMVGQKLRNEGGKSRSDPKPPAR